MPTTLKDNSAGARRWEEMNDPTAQLSTRAQSRIKGGFYSKFHVIFLQGN